MSSDLTSSTATLVDARSPTAADDEVDDTLCVQELRRDKETLTEGDSPDTVSSSPDRSEQEKKIEQILKDPSFHKCPDKMLAMYQLCKQLEETTATPTPAEQS